MFLDLDCGPAKDYPDQRSALDALKKFCSQLDLPKPQLVNSGRGIHAYWLLSEEAPADKWRSVAERLKKACEHKKLYADPAVTADLARVLRVPGTHNYKGDPLPVQLLGSALPETVAIVGGAATGCQLASVLAAFGAKVSLLEIAPRLLGMEDVIISDTIAESFNERGIDVITDIDGVERIETGNHAYTIFYTADDQEKQLGVEAVILATGWPGNADNLNLEAAGVQSERGYVLVDEYLRTSSEHIFAAGDITGRMMLVQSAGYEARIAAENAVLGAGQPYTHKIVPHGGFTDPEYGSVGLTEERARVLEPDCIITTVPYSALDRSIIDGHPEGSCKLIVSQETHRILGAHVVGEQALEIVQLVAAGMAADMWVEHLAELELAYPTYTAIIGLVARKIVHELGVMPFSPQLRSMGKPYAAEWERSAT